MAFRAKRILVHIDTTSARRPALTRAAQWAKKCGGTLRVVDVLVPLPTLSPAAERLEALALAEMADRLAAAATAATRLRVPVTTAVLVGDVASALVAESVAWRADVLLRSHGIHGASPIPIGPEDGQLLRRCPCPVWLVTPRQATGEKVVVAAVDPDPADVARHRLSVRVARAAMAVAAETGAALHLVHVWSAYGHRLMAAHGSRADVNAYVVACRQSAEERLASLRWDARLPSSARVHLLEGVADDVLATFVARRRASLVVMGTVARTGLAGLIVGNTAERVLRQVRCSVLALKPAGFADAMLEARR